MFEDIIPVVANYSKLKQELNKVQGFLENSLRDKLKQATTDEIVDTIIELLNNQKAPEQLAHENLMYLENLKLD